MRERDVKVGFTGTRGQVSTAQAECLQIVLETNADVILEAHHGDCVGADDMFAHMIMQLDREIRIISHPPINSSLRAFTYHHFELPAKPYIERNHDIVDACHLMVACPSTNHNVLRSGTWATIRYARKQRKDIMICYPDGSHELVQHKNKLPI